MATNYYIGIGGTGARVAEALLHTCAAGYGPESLTLFLIDPDEGNGNLSRTKELLTRYQTVRSLLRGSADLDIPLFKTEIRAPEPLVWSIFESGDTTLGSYINHANFKESDPGLYDLVNVLFTRGELAENLNEGFRGHPAIGAVVMAEPPEGREPWKTFWADVDAAQRENEIRVFLAGSIFGGTGAAGVPTLGAPDMLKFHPRARINDRSSKITLGGVLVLPYFSVDASDAPTDGRLFVSSRDFPIATRAALRFYSEKDLAFDQLYLAGDSLAQTVGEFSAGSSQQENRPHYVELVSALAAEDFYLQPDGEAATDRYHIAGRRGQSLSWNELPVTRELGQVSRRAAELKRRLVSMTTFAYALVDYGYPALEMNPKQVRAAWHGDHFDPKRSRKDPTKDPRQPEQMAVLTALRDYSMRFLRWIASMDEGPDGAVKLVRRDRLFGQGGFIGHARDLSAIGTFLHGPSQENDFNHFRNLLDAPIELSDRLPPAAKYATLFYDAANRFAEDTYGLVPETTGNA